MNDGCKWLLNGGVIPFSWAHLLTKKSGRNRAAVNQIRELQRKIHWQNYKNYKEYKVYIPSGYD